MYSRMIYLMTPLVCVRKEIHNRVVSFYIFSLKCKESTGIRYWIC